MKLDGHYLPVLLSSMMSSKVFQTMWITCDKIPNLVLHDPDPGMIEFHPIELCHARLFSIKASKLARMHNGRRHSHKIESLPSLRTSSFNYIQTTLIWTPTS